MADEIPHLRGLDVAGLRRRWRSTFRKEAPSHLARHLLVAVLGYRIQADALGELDPATIRLLGSVGSGSTDVEPRAIL